jgi:polyribonucleotide nucleotidyltransferase
VHLGIPFAGPIGAARVGYANGQYILNPSVQELKTSQMDLVVAGTETAVLMVESEAKNLSEQIMLGAVVFGHTEMKKVIDAIHDLVAEGGKPEIEWNPPPKNETLIAAVARVGEAKIRDALPDQGKAGPHAAAARRHQPDHGRPDRRSKAAGQPAPDSSKSATSCSTWKPRSCVRRSWKASRASTAATPAPCVRSRSAPRVLPRTHGSALFTRGETQALVVATLGTAPRQPEDRRADGRVHRFVHDALQHASVRHRRNRPRRFPEAPRNRPRPPGQARTGRRLPEADEFSYSVRLVSEITESNGSSSMASVCGGCLALMDAGVPMKRTWPASPWA